MRSRMMTTLWVIDRANQYYMVLRWYMFLFFGLRRDGTGDSFIILGKCLIRFELVRRWLDLCCLYHYSLLLCTVV